MADVDAAIEHLGAVTILGRGLGAYVGLLSAGARAELVRGVVLADGPGLVGGGIRPGSAYVLTVDDEIDATPDPYALFELSRDVRPPDYAQEYVRQVMQWSGLDRPIAVTTVTKPEWIEAVIDEPGVVEITLDEALRLFASDVVMLSVSASPQAGDRRVEHRVDQLIASGVVESEAEQAGYRPSRASRSTSPGQPSAGRCRRSIPGRRPRSSRPRPSRRSWWRPAAPSGGSC